MVLVLKTIAVQINGAFSLCMRSTEVSAANFCIPFFFSMKIFNVMLSIDLNLRNHVVIKELSESYTVKEYREFCV